MSLTNQPAKAKPISTPVNRIAYGAFVLLSLYLFITGSYNDSLANLGIALIFDPFDQTVRWDNRPLWQRAWLIVHLLLMVGIALIYWKHL